MNLFLRDCPQHDQIDRYLNGGLPTHESIVLETHFNECALCEETFRGRVDGQQDTLDVLLQELLTQDNALSVESNSKPEPEIQNLIASLQAIGPREIGQAERLAFDRAAEILRLIKSDGDEEGFGKLGHYELTELLGSGSTGVVFAAVDQRLNREIAIKILRPSLGLAAQDRFLLEAQAAAAIAHENTITIFDVGQIQGLAYLTMQLLPGETLEDRLQRATFLPEPEVRKIADQICAGLAEAHKKNVIHRDIKPANLWYDTTRDQIKLLDFGLARIADLNPQLTASGILAGTPSYMSPEQTRGQELDGRSDLFSLGCLLYRCVTGRLPFGSTSVLATLQSIQHDSPIPPARMNPNCSIELSDLIMKLLEKHPEHRPNSAADFRHALAAPRHHWRFAADYSDASSVRPQFQPATKSGSGRFIRRNLFAIGLGCLGLGGFLFGNDVIRIATNQGEIMIESSDPNIKIEIRQAGEVVQIIDTSTEQRIDIQAGQYTIQPRGSNGEFVVTPQAITLSRGGKQVVRVERAAGSRITQFPDQTPVQNAIGAAVDSSLESGSPTYDGRTYEQWLTLINRERNVDTVCDSIRALTKLSEDVPQRQAEVLTTITPFVRRYGSLVIGGKNSGTSFHNAFITYFSSMSAESVVDFIEQEIKDGTIESREFLVFLSLIGSIYEHDSKRQAQHRVARRTANHRLNEAYITTINRLAQQGRLDESNSLNQLVGYSEFWTTTHPRTIEPSLMNQIAEQYQQAYKKSSVLRTKLIFANHCLTLQAEIPGFATELRRWMTDPNVSPNDRRELLKSLINWGSIEPKMLIPGWVELARNLPTLLPEQDRTTTSLADDRPTNFGWLDIAITGHPVHFGLIAEGNVELFGRINQIRNYNPSIGALGGAGMSGGGGGGGQGATGAIGGLGSSDVGGMGAGGAGGGGNGICTYRLTFDHNQGLQLIILRQLAQYQGKLDADTAALAQQWIRSLIQETDPVQLFVDKKMIPEQELTEAQLASLKQIVINEFAETAIELLSPQPPAAGAAKPDLEFLAIPPPPQAFGKGGGLGGGMF